MVQIVVTAKAKDKSGVETTATDTADINSSPVWSYSPTVKYETLYQSGDFFEDTLARITTPSYVELPAGLDAEINDFSQGGGQYGVYAPKCLGLVGPGPTQARIKMKKNSSTKVGSVPAQSTKQVNPLYMMRLGPNSGSVKAAVHCYGFTIMGTDQPVDTRIGIPHNYNGLRDYYGFGSTYENIVVHGIPGDWNSPPGETFQLSTYRSTNCFFKNVEVHGFDEAGLRVGSGTFGSNGDTGTTVEDCFFHDAWVSGFTASNAGGPGSSPCKDFTSRRVRIWHNANHQPWVRPGYIGGTGGKNFGTINHEGLAGTILHEYPDLKYTNPEKVGNHVFMGSWAPVPDAKVTIIEPDWHPELGHLAGTTAHNDAFVVMMPVTYAGQPNSQVTPPVVVKGGVTLEPVYKTGSWPAVDPKKQYIVQR